MKGNEKYILAGAVILAALLVFASYKFFYSADIEKADQIQNDINTLQARMDELNAKVANRAMYEKGIANAQDIIDTVLSIYGPGNTPQKSIMMIVDICKKTGVSVSDISFISDKIVYSSIDESETDVTSDEKVEYQTLSTGEDVEGIRIFKSGVSLKLSSGYTQLKKIHNYVNYYPERMNAETFNVTFNPETGKLDVLMNINMYSVVDKNHKYEDPVVEGIELSSDNPFKTLEIPTEEEEEETAEGENVNPNANAGNNAETNNNNANTNSSNESNEAGSGEENNKTE